MRCLKAKRLISDYVDHNLDPKKNSALAEHLKSCLECQLFIEDFQSIIKSARELEEISPSSQAWLNIKARLKAKKELTAALEIQKRRWFGILVYQPKLKYALGSVLLLAIIVAAVTLSLRYWKGGKAIWENDRQRYTIAKLEEAEHHYQLAIKALAAAASSQKENLDPQVANIFKTNLEIIDASINACKQAVLEEPENIDARDYLLFAYREKLDLLDEMIAIKSTSSPKKEFEKTL